MAKYLSNRQQNLNIGIVSYTEDKTVLEVTGKVGIGTTNATSKLHVVGDARITGVVTATTFVGALTGTASSTTNIPNLTGAITSNNTTTSLGSFTSDQLSTALSDKTGTGVAVFATSPTLVTPVLGAATATSIVVSSGSTFTNGPILVGTTTSTGTASQKLQVTGGAYVSGSVGIGTTNPVSKLHVIGDGRFTGVVTATTFVGALTGTATSTTNIPNLTGAITSVNTTTSLGSFTSSQLAAALTDETGSGSAVFATSPTLVTPVLGAATATSIVVGSGVTLSSSGINVSGVITATSFSGSGANLTGVSAGSTVADDATTNAAFYPVFTQTTSGTITASKVSTTKLNFNPSTGTLSATVFTSLSDGTQKTNIRPVENAAYIVSQMNGVYYDWIDGHNTGSVGVIAQEIEKVLPEVVSTNDQGLKSVSYGNIVGVLIEAIKEQQVRIEELERKSNA